jgi:hypothetical protein
MMGIPLVLIEKLFSISFTFFKILGYFIFTAALLTCMYICITIAALMGVNESNAWAFNYFTSFSIDFFMINPLLNYIKVSIYQWSILYTHFIAVLIQKILKDKVENALKDEIK